MYLGSSIIFENEEDGYLGVVKRAIELECNTFMFYLGSSTGGKKPKIEELHIEEARKILRDNNIDEKKIVIHAPFNINLSNSKKEYVWKYSIRNVVNEIALMDELGINLLVLHPGSTVGADFETASEYLINGLNKVFEDTPNSNVKICLETMVGKTNEMGKTFEELEYIISHVNQRYINRIGVCLDTCHIHDHGYDLTNHKKLLKEFDDVIGLEYLHVIHLNDSKATEKTALKNRDRHGNIGVGSIGFDALHNILTDERLSEIPFILETPRLDEGYKSRSEEMKMLKEGCYVKDWDKKYNQ